MRNNVITHYPPTRYSSGNAFISLQYSLVQWEFRIRTLHDIKQGQSVHLREAIDKGGKNLSDQRQNLT